MSSPRGLVRVSSSRCSGPACWPAPAAEKAAPPPPPPPEVLVTPVVRRDVPVPMELVGQTRGLPGRRDPGACRGLPRRRRLQRGHAGAQGSGALPHRSQAARGLAGNTRRPNSGPRRPATRRRRTTSSACSHWPRSRPSVPRNSTTPSPRPTRPDRRSRPARPRSTGCRSISGYTNVTSPIDGLVGTTLVKAGSLVGRGESTLLTTVSQIDPILFRAGISEAEYLRIARRAEELAQGQQRQGADRPDAGRRHRSTRTRVTWTPSSGPSTRPRAR